MNVDTTSPTRTLFDAAAARAVLQRIHGLRPDSPAQWGKMRVAQMLAHCQVPLRVALGELVLRRGLIGLLFGRLAKRSLLAKEPFKRDMPTAPQFRVTDERDFAIEKANLIALVQRFQAGGPAGLTKKPHPFFGAMTSEEWDALQWKHLDHHLRQFGA